MPCGRALQSRILTNVHASVSSLMIGCINVLPPRHRKGLYASLRLGRLPVRLLVSGLVEVLAKGWVADSSALEGLGAMDRSLGMLLICLSGVALDSAGCSKATDSCRRGGLVDV
jgi:hypothetical protein